MLSPSLKINPPYPADKMPPAVTSCPPHTRLPLTPHLSLFHFLLHSSLITSLPLPPFYSLLTINPFLLLQPSASHSYALTNCTYLSHCHSPNPLFLAVYFSSSFPLVSLYFSVSLKYHYSINPLGSWIQSVPLTNEGSTHTYMLAH